MSIAATNTHRRPAVLALLAAASLSVSDAFCFPSTNTRIQMKLAANSAPSLDAILWDMDGVLAETEKDAHRVAFNKVFADRSLDTEWTVEGYGKLLEVGGGKERMTAHWNAVGWPSAFDDTEDDEEQRQARVKELHLAKTDVFNELIREGGVPLRPGVERLIDEALDSGKQLAVCSTSNEKAVKNLVNTLLGPERAAKFSIFAGDCVSRKKPAPDIYNLAVDTLDLDKSRCLIVEDSGIGWGAAKAAGICCVVTKSVYTAHEDFTGADAIVTDLDGTDGASDPVTLETVEGLLQQRQ
ncbi:unnamed protein product [Pseudo-nitzschia multistriata]|uniref:Uncharacterized protein n=1 Tax=Pseudo-nitzschia multistriata TaxID=183589 RepID=A0A448ZR28_9STRA|nr:unnamed protein product [Pseudo-nitzschia multistriata]